MSKTTSKTIGELNGWNAFSLSIFLKTWPFLVAWFIWATPNIILNTEARTKDDRFTTVDWERGKAELKQFHRDDMEEHMVEIIGMIGAQD